MAKSFNDALSIILKHEGGYVNNPLDRGGATNYGITQKVYEAFKGRAVTIDEMKKMPLSDVRAIYKKQYWDKIGGDKVKFYTIALALFDQGVNRGPVAAIKQAQRVLGIPQDGNVGPKTLAALNAVQEASFLPKFLAESEAAYKSIVDKNPTQVAFINGWLKRVRDLGSETSKWIGTINKQAIGIGALLVIALGIGGFMYMKRNKK